MSEGFQIIESEELAALVANSSHDQFTVAILTWLAERLNLATTGPLSGLRFAVIRVQYVSRYPAIGVKYPNNDGPDKELFILEAISEILRTTNLQTFARHLLTRDSWSAVAAELLG